MKAVVCDRPGPPDVLRLEDIDKPAVPDDGVLVRVRAASVNPADAFALTRVARLMNRKPEVMGRDFAGTVEAVGGSVKQFAPGDEVFGAKRGALAEYVCVPEQGAVVRKPGNLTFEQAGVVGVAGVTALQAVRDHGQVRSGQKVLINGASGGVGTFAVQIAKASGANVTGVCSTGNVDMVRSIGAETVIDYKREDFTRSGMRYDVMLDVAGSRSWSACTRVLDPKATFVAVGAKGPSHLVKGRLASLGASQRWIFFLARVDQAALTAMQELLAAGKVAPVIDRRFELSEVAEAFSYLMERHAKGKILITL